MLTATAPSVSPRNERCPLCGADFDAAGTKLFATDFCDGTLAIVGVDLVSGPAPLPARAGAAMATASAAVATTKRRIMDVSSVERGSGVGTEAPSPRTAG